jgi:hypothetical protein
MDGPGRIIYENGDYMVGEYEEGYLNGTGYYSIYGDVYVGEFF